MQLHKFKHKQHKAKTKKGLCITYVALFFLVLVSPFVYSQEAVKYKVDTIMLMKNEAAILNTNNGSDCICSINNISKSQIATVVNIGDTQNIRFNDSTFFNGIHQLKIQRQIIAVGDFKGSQLTVSNLSPYKITIIIIFLCTKDEEEE